jgi:hypothetical protein
LIVRQIDFHADGTKTVTETPDPVPPASGPRTISPREFMDRLSPEKQDAIFAAALQSPAILKLLVRLSAAVEVDLDFPETVLGVQAMKAAGLLTAEEAVAVLA